MPHSGGDGYNVHLARQDAGKEVGRRGERAAEKPAFAQSSLLSTPGRCVLASRCGAGLQRRSQRRRTDGTRSGCRPREGGRGRAGIVPHFQRLTGRSAAAAADAIAITSASHSYFRSLFTFRAVNTAHRRVLLFFSFSFSEACDLTVHITGLNDRRRAGPGTGLHRAPRRGSPLTVTGVARPLFR